MGSPTEGPVTLAGIWSDFAETQCARYSPLYERIAHTVAADDDLLDLIREAPSRSHQPNVLLAAVHFLLLGGLEHPLAAVYAGTATDDPGPLFVDLCRAHRQEILEVMATHHTNTNEVGRSAVLGPALTAAAAGTEAGTEVGIVDVGCSAGLNLRCDRYLLDYGPAGTTGPPEAAVRIPCTVLAGRPPIAPRLPVIGARVGLDRDPVDVRDEAAARWLLACIWPDTGRLERTRIAIAEARRDPPTLHAGEAVEQVARLVHALPAGLLPVVTTTWMLAYLSPEGRVAFRERLADASHGRDVAWISAEGRGVVDLFPIEPPVGPEGIEASVLGLTRFHAGRVLDTALLGFVHPHGTWMDWRG